MLLDILPADEQQAGTARDPADLLSAMQQRAAVDLPQGQPLLLPSTGHLVNPLSLAEAVLCGPCSAQPYVVVGSGESCERKQASFVGGGTYSIAAGTFVGAIVVFAVVLYARDSINRRGLTVLLFGVGLQLADCLTDMGLVFSMWQSESQGCGHGLWTLVASGSMTLVTVSNLACSMWVVQRVQNYSNTVRDAIVSDSRRLTTVLSLGMAGVSVLHLLETEMFHLELLSAFRNDQRGREMLRRSIAVAQIPQLLLEDLVQLLVQGALVSQLREGEAVPTIVMASIAFSAINALKMVVTVLVPILFASEVSSWRGLRVEAALGKRDKDKDSKGQQQGATSGPRAAGAHSDLETGAVAGQGKSRVDALTASRMVMVLNPAAKQPPTAAKQPSKQAVQRQPQEAES